MNSKQLLETLRLKIAAHEGELHALNAQAEILRARLDSLRYALHAAAQLDDVKAEAAAKLEAAVDDVKAKPKPTN